MRKVRRGFTLVEVALFLAVTGVLFVGIIAGVQNSMFQQKYNDSVQSFAEFLRSVYSQTMNVENSSVKSGRSNMAIYGKLVTFGEELDFEGNKNEDGEIFTYTVVGEIIEGFGSDNTLMELRRAKVNVAIKDEEKGEYQLAGIADQYLPKWRAGIEIDNGYEDFKGALLIIRHPRSGTVFTFVLRDDLNDETIEVNESLKEQSSTLGDLLLRYLPKENEPNNGNIFKVEQVDFCVNPNKGTNGVRRDIRLIRGARNASGVEVIGQDDDTVVDGVKVGNRCVE